MAAGPAGIDAVAVEPETHAPDGLRRLTRREPGGLVLVAPGASLALAATLAFASSGGRSTGCRASHGAAIVTRPDTDIAHDGPMNRATLLATIAAGRARLEGALERLSDGAMLERVDDGGRARTSSPTSRPGSAGSSTLLETAPRRDVRRASRPTS